MFLSVYVPIPLLPNRASLPLRPAGTVWEIKAEEGQEVKAGDTLVSCQPRLFISDVGARPGGYREPGAVPHDQRTHSTRAHTNKTLPMLHNRLCLRP